MRTAFEILPVGPACLTSQPSSLHLQNVNFLQTCKYNQNPVRIKANWQNICKLHAWKQNSQSVA